MNVVVSILQDVQNSRFASPSTIIVFDHLVTLDQEIELVWRSSWTTGKLLFLLNRYYPLCTVVYNQYVLFNVHLTDQVHLARAVLTRNRCVTWLSWQGWSSLASVIVAETILQLRLYALYSLNRKVLLVMASFFIVSTASAATILGLVFSKIKTNAMSLGGLEFCVPSQVPSYFYAYWIPILVFESLLCGMSIARGFQTFRQRYSVFQSGKHLITILLRDSVIYFLVIFFAYLVNCLIWTTGVVGLIEIPVGFSVAMSCVMGSRLVLNVRHVKRQMELGLSDNGRDVLHIPFYSHQAAVANRVVFATRRSMIDTVSILPTEYIEMRGPELKPGAPGPSYQGPVSL
ncbi:hypothetical protein FIBSPDRAFT_954158 [Athelia psychrophila]|uniref:DUF6533 domain-containing protein n=1 Tax=Athelia psychrophila TaxID=1759441 RepID=A0A166JL24_9AGAM|nr:hypothetical protein FIBSPDRAFT_954158 [Fibularhizoctonia sp. CBS 109695]